MCTALTEYVSAIAISSTPSSRAIAATRRRRSGSLEGSATWKRRIPLRTTHRNASRITSSPAGTQVMKRIPEVMKLSGVCGIAALISRSRSHGSSRWKRTATAMCVLEVKSTAWKPTRSSIGAIARMSSSGRRVALQRLWLPSRVVVSTMSTSPRVRSTLIGRAAPGREARRSPRAPRSPRTPRRSSRRLLQGRSSSSS